MHFEESYLWIPAIGVNYHVGVDGLSIPLVFLTALLTTLSLFYSAYTIDVRVKEYFALFLVLETGMTGVFVSLDLFLFYVFWEVGLVPMYFLIGVWGGPRREYAAIKFFLYTLTGSVFMLLAIIGIYFTTGSFDILNAIQAKPFANNFTLQSLAFWAFFLAFAIKVPMWPFHTWLPDAHVEAPTAGSVILAGILLKLGGYGFFRVLLPIFPQAFNQYAIIIAVLALISIVYGALVSMAQWDFKKLIAYSSVNHMGYVMLGVAAAAFTLNTNSAILDSRAIALNGAALQMFNHGVITGGLFLLVGVLYERSHVRDLKAFGGLGAKLPIYYGITMVTCFASLGLPGLAGFVSEFMVFRGAFPIIPIIAAIAITGVVITAAMFLWKVIQGIFLGPLNEKWAGLKDMQPFEVITLVPLLILMFAIGLYPGPILNLINSAMLAILGKM
jgi:NADH-quinone oxidoreductase subunit M